MMNAAGPGDASIRRRLFFALDPEESLRRHMSQVLDKALARHDGAGRRVPSEKLHVTLVFLGGVEDAQLSCIERQAAVGGTPFELVLDRVDYRRQSGILWLAPSRPPAAMDALYSALRRAVTDCGVIVEDRPFRAHMTLMRKVRRRPPPVELEPIVWPVDRYTLMESVPGGAYRPLAHWTLR